MTTRGILSGALRILPMECMDIQQEIGTMASKFFGRNEHTADRVIRVVLGLGLLSLVFVGPRTMWGLLGLIPLVTGLAGTCPVYSILGVSTCSHGEA